MTNDELLERANKVLEGSGYVATHIGPPSVGVQGDGRVYAPSIILDIGFNAGPPDWERVGKYVTEIINQIPGLTRVLIDASS